MCHQADFQSKIKVQKAKLAARDLQTLRSAATLITRTLGEIKDLKAEVVRLERDLAGSGSLKTVDEVQHEVNVIANEMYVVYSQVTDMLTFAARTCRGKPARSHRKKSSRRMLYEVTVTTSARRP